MLRTVCISVVISAFVSLGMICYYDTHLALKIETVDVKGYVKTIEKQVEKGQMDTAQMKESVKRLSQAVRREAKGNNIVILKEVVVGGRVKEIKP